MNFTSKLLSAIAVATPIIMGLTAIQIEGELFTLTNILSNVATSGLFLGLATATAYVGYKAFNTLVDTTINATAKGRQATGNIANTASNAFSHVVSSAKSYMPSRANGPVQGVVDHDVDNVVADPEPPKNKR